MWFKNLAVYRFSENFSLKNDELEQNLLALAFKSCAAHDEFSFGWISPMGKSGDGLIHACNGYIMLCAKKEEKVIPASVINEMLQDKISEIEENEGRKIPQKERNRIKDELIFELLPRAFSFSKKTFAYLDLKGGWLVVDAASPKKAEDLLSLLRKSLGSLPVVPVTTDLKPSLVMTDWLLNNSSPKDILIEDECELRSPEEDGSIIRCKRHDLGLPEIKNHLDNGKLVIKLALNWSDRLSFILDENLSIKRLKFLDLIEEQLSEIETDDDIHQFDAEFSIMTVEIDHLLTRLLQLFSAEVMNK